MSLDADIIYLRFIYVWMEYSIDKADRWRLVGILLRKDNSHSPYTLYYEKSVHVLSLIITKERVNR